jgi:hypothetical protein
MEKMRAITNGHDHQKMIEGTDMEAKGGDLAIMTTTDPTAKLLQGTKTTITKGTTCNVLPFTKGRTTMKLLFPGSLIASQNKI